jgi:hypothetical protein
MARREHLHPYERGVLVVTSIEWMNTEDSYERGEIGQTFTVLAEENVGRYRTPAEMRQDLIGRFGLPEDRDAWLAFDDGRIDVQFQVDVDNNPPTARERERWMRGETQLWAAYVTIHFVEAFEATPSRERIAEMFGIAEE